MVFFKELEQPRKKLLEAGFEPVRAAREERITNHGFVLSVEQYQQLQAPFLPAMLVYLLKRELGGTYRVVSWDIYAPLAIGNDSGAVFRGLLEYIENGQERFNERVKQQVGGGK